MKIISQISAIVTTLVFLLGSTGISIYHHTCFTHHANETVVYPGIFTATSDCSCTASASADHAFHGEKACCSGTGCHLQSSSCCKSETIFLKLKSDFLPGQSDALIIDLPSIPYSLHEINPVATDPPDHSGYPIFEHFAPPLTGRALIHFLHQIKLPFSPSI